MQKYAVVTTDLLNLRAGPSTTAQIVSQLKTGTILDVMADPGFDWLQVSVDGTATQGFVAKQYVTLTDTKPAPAASSSLPSPANTPTTSPTTPPPRWPSLAPPPPPCPPT